MKKNNKRRRNFWIIVTIIYFVGGLLFLSSYNVNQVYQTRLVRQLGETVDFVEEPGIYFITPFLQDSITIYTGERMYDVPVTNVTTSDKKTMEADAFVTWKIDDAQKYYRQLSSADAATGRLSSSVYSAMKKVISATTQDDVIAGKDGTLSNTILESITSLDNYGIIVHTFDIKGLDLPAENKASVFERMTSERKAKTAAYTAEGDKTYTESKALVDQEERITISDAEAKAAQIRADGEEQYYEILRTAYNATPEKEMFYRYWLGLETLKETLRNGATIQITEDDVLYKILVNTQ